MYRPREHTKKLTSSDNVCTQKKHWCKHTHLDDDNSNIQNIYAYPSSKEDHETGEVTESPPINLPSKKCFSPTSIAVVDTIS
jgi:hypothetical protein